MSSAPATPKGDVLGVPGPESDPGPEADGATELSESSSPFDVHLDPEELDLEEDPAVSLGMSVPAAVEFRTSVPTDPSDAQREPLDSGEADARPSGVPETVSESAIVDALSTRVSPDPTPEAAPVQPAPFSRGMNGRYASQSLIASKYRIEGAIARGGMGQVYLATQLPLGRKVAIKVVMQQPGDANFRERFLLEASTCARLGHANIVVIYDYGETDKGDLFTVMEYLGRRSLARVIRSEQRLSPLRACSIALQIGRALRAAHRAGVVHRDLKPSNVMLLEDPEGGSAFDLVKVVDFGLAKVFEGEDAEADRLTRAGMLLGSPRYMSPEQVRNRSIDPRSDIYSLGVILFHMLTGRPPFDGEHPSEILAQQLRDPAPSFVEVAPDVSVPFQLEGLVQRCLEKRPDDRHQRIEDVLVELKQILLYLGGDAPGAMQLAEATGVTPLASNPSLTSASGMAFAAPDLSHSHATHENSEAYPRPAKNSPWWGLAVVMGAVVATLAFWAIILG